MKCKEVHKNFTQSLEQSLLENQKATFEDHLKHCKSCSDAFERFKSIYKIPLNEIGQYAPNPFMAQKVIQKVEQLSTQPKGLPRVALPRSIALSLAIGGIALGIVVGTLLSTATLSQSPNADAFEQLAEEYFPSNLFSPYELIDNEN